MQVQNPILQQIAGRNLNSTLSILSAIRKGNVETLFNQLINSNPDFRRFVELNSGKSTEQIVQENNIDVTQLREILRSTGAPER